MWPTNGTLQTMACWTAHSVIGPPEPKIEEHASLSKCLSNSMPKMPPLPSARHLASPSAAFLGAEKSRFFRATTSRQFAINRSRDGAGGR